MRIPGIGNLTKKAAQNKAMKTLKKAGIKKSKRVIKAEYLDYCADGNRSAKDKAGFLAVDKVNGHICLDVYNLTQDMVSLEDRISYRKKMVEGEMPMERIPPVDHQKGGSKQLAVKCRYCGHKEKCWPLLRTFIYSTGPVFLTKTVKVPNVPEVTKT